MTERLFWSEPYRTSFQAQIVSACRHDGSYAVELDRTCFYPTSGGQPHDTGTLNGVRVVDVYEEGDHILHVLASELAPGPVNGEIDWARRLDHMQQHSGQHVLSQAWVSVAKAETVSFHLGEEACTIDIACADVREEQVEAAEDLANQIIWANLPVTAREYAPEEIHAVPLRKPPAKSGTIRVIAIGTFDYSACGGTHVQATGEIGSIHMIGTEKHRGVTRVSFVCGGRALRSQREFRRIVQSSAGQLSVHPSELPEAITRMLDEIHHLQKQNEEAYKRLLDTEFKVWHQSSSEQAGWHVICRMIDYPPALMRQAAQELAGQEGTIALLASRSPNAQFCFAASQGAPLNMGSLLRQALQPFGGKGGGSALLAQGGGVQDELVEDVLSQAYALVKNQLSQEGDTPPAQES